MFLPVVAYLAFHLVVVGEPWPSTFFAKPAEYAVERAEPILARWAEQAGPPLTAIGWILLPGVLLAIRSAIRDRSIGRLAPLAWILLHWTAYAVRLPVNYQHGRYAMPTIPILLLVGMEGLHGWIAAEPPWRRILGRAWIGSAIAGSAVFWWLGGRAYAIDVAVIETEMVAASRWIADHTEVEARIAAHDIGALGYFGGREILDLAGLVSPEVIPFLRDETRLAAYLDAHGADYLMTFPGWYPALVERGERVFTTRATASPAAGGENMAVYRWRLAGVAEGLSPMLYSASEPARRAWNPLAY
jgi:hypothetical protein